jgi:hypothetical protein
MLRNILDLLFPVRRSRKHQKRVRQLPLRNHLRMEFLESRNLLAALTSDALDYAPGSNVLLSGSGYTPGETIDVAIVSDIGTGGSLVIIDGGDGDGDGAADGSFTALWNVGYDNVDATLMATALGESSGETASTTFTDQLTGAIFTTNADGSTVNQNIYDSKLDVYLNGGPDNSGSHHLPAGDYYFQVTDPSGSVLLSTDDISEREVHVSSDGLIDAYLGSTHGIGSDVGTGAVTVQLIPYSDTPNAGGEYKVWMTPVGAYDPSKQNSNFGFVESDSKTDNFKVLEDDDPVVKQSTIVISGFKFEDTNGDGDIAGDSKIDWAQINFDDDTDDTSLLASKAATAASGYSYAIIATSVNNGPYTFVLDVDGNALTTLDDVTLDANTTYHVYESADAAWTQTYGIGGYTVSLNSATGDVTTSAEFGPDTLDFGNFENIDICGVKYQDHSGDGFSATNTVLGGFLIYLDGTGTGTANGLFDYTDVNTNGRFDVETDTALEEYQLTGANGSYCFTNLGPGTYSVQESTANQTDPANWIQTGGNGGYSVVASSGVNRPSATDPAHFLDFANVHIGTHNGLTIGFYANKNGQTLLTGSSSGPSSNTVKPAIAAYLQSVLAGTGTNSVLVLGTSYLTLADLGNYSKLNSVLKQATATNMANMLSAQLLATVLNCSFTSTTGISASESIYLPAMTRLSGKSNDTVQGWLLAGGTNPVNNPGVKTSAGDSYVTIQELIDAAVKELKTNKNTTATSADRNFQEGLKDCFDGINNGDPIFVL